MPKFSSSSHTARTGSVTGDLSQNINNSEYVSPDRFCLTYSLNSFLYCLYSPDIVFVLPWTLKYFIIYSGDAIVICWFICVFPDRMKDSLFI